ncbi:MAG: hypothetical protein KAI24_20115 [Planctomycetes bacterium]|nr:hypothetical protein [Planctomycetota bacterium]
MFAGACVTGSYDQVSINEPVDLEALRALEPGRDDLASCLAKLGAPVAVQEYRVAADRSSGMALIWWWSRRYGWGLDISVPVYDEQSVSFEMDFGGTDMPGCVLWFGEDLVLERWREGLVGELLAGRRRPSPVLDDA